MAAVRVRRSKAPPGMRIIDWYVLKLAFWPMLGALGVTLVALLLERVLRLLNLLSASSDRFGFVAELAANLVPHYLGLTLPAAYFVALFIVIARLNDGSEIDAFLASGVSLSRLVAPYVCLGVALAMISLILFGFIQPYSRYGYRAVLHAAVNAGWNGRLQAQTFVSPDDKVTMTADGADAAGRRLERIFIRRMLADGREEVTTAKSAEIRPHADGKGVTLVLESGQQLRTNPRGETDILNFGALNTDVPLAGAASLLRARGGDERELTLFELVHEAGSSRSMIPEQTLLAELYARLARALALPFLPLLAMSLGLTAKRGGRTPGLIVAGLILLAFQHLVQLGQGLAVAGHASALLAVGAPFAGFVALSLWMFISSRKRPGQTPIGTAIEAAGDALRRLRPPTPIPQASR